MELSNYDAWKLTAPEDDRSCFIDDFDPQMDTIREFDAMDKVVTPAGRTAVVVGCEWDDELELRRFKVQYVEFEINDDGEEEYETDWFYADRLKLAK